MISPVVWATLTNNHVPLLISSPSTISPSNVSSKSSSPSTSASISGPIVASSVKTTSPPPSASSATSAESNSAAISDNSQEITNTAASTSTQTSFQVNIPSPTFRIEFPTHIDRTVTIGRHPASSLVLPDMHISSKHLTLRQITSNGYRKIIIEDTSSNGTWVNGERVAKGVPIELKDGTEISLPCEEANRQEYSFVFRIIGSPLVQTTPTQAPMQASDEIAGSVSSVVNVSPNQFSGYIDNQLAEEWRMIQDQCDSLSREASRVAACVYENSENIQELLSISKRGIFSIASKRSSLSSIGSGSSNSSNAAGSQKSSPSSSKHVRIAPNIVSDLGELAGMENSDLIYQNKNAQQENLLSLEAAKEMLQAIKNIEMILESSTNTSLASISMSSSTSESSNVSSMSRKTTELLTQNQQQSEKESQNTNHDSDILAAIRQAISKRSDWEKMISDNS